MAHLVCLNIERSRHLARFIPFLAERKPDVVCLQELDEGDIPRIMAEVGLGHCHFAPMARLSADTRPFGIAILTRTPPESAETLPYAGGGSGTEVFDRRDAETRVATCRYVLACVKIDIGDTRFTIATTHFPWTPEGDARPFQFDAAEALIRTLGTAPVILAGDFNAPRGGPVFARLSAIWQDCIPPDITSSLDPELHRAGPLDLMVDGLFATPDYRIDDVQFHTGVSDHRAITARIASRN
jgi:endonuclease/exonuclease/phosphatase family metal-dependent hydrolase